MRRQHETNENTGAHFDELYAGPRRLEMLPLAPLEVLLPLLCQDTSGGEYPLKVLDVGCGWGQYGEYLFSENNYVHGVDFAEGAIEEARSKFPGAVWKCADFAQFGLPYPDRYFDRVICLETLEHVPDPAALIREIHRVLEPGGLAILGVPYREELVHVTEHLWGFSEEDWPALMAPFSQHTTLRYGAFAETWEHFLVLGVK